MWVISPDKPERLRALWEDKKLTFPSLLDPEAEVIRAYGLLNEHRPPLPHPATMVIDKDGTITWLEVDENYRVRPATETVLEALEELAHGTDSAQCEASPVSKPSRNTSTLATRTIRATDGTPWSSTRNSR